MMAQQAPGEFGSRMASQRAGTGHRHERGSDVCGHRWQRQPRELRTTVNDLVSAPLGSLLTIIIIQNTSAPEDKDNIGIGESLSRLPPRVLSAVFGLPADTFNSFKKIDNSIVILRPT
ncbi:MAG: hypothetical protein K2X52_11040 [Mycobacteriaceae bacterium]|nr:hypothetical protein [Mycobacteriaceae bacterium]